MVCAAAGAALHGGARRCVVFRPQGVCYGPQLLAQKREDDGTVLIEGLSRLELQCRGVDGDVPRWRRDEAGGPGGAELFRTPGSLGPTRGTPVKPAQGSA